MLKRFTPAQKLKALAATVGISNSVLIYGDKVAVIPGIPVNLAHCWPFFMILAGAIHSTASVFVTPPAPTAPNPKP